MKKSRFNESQILAILKQGESGVPVSDLCREHGISNATYYTSHNQFNVNIFLANVCADDVFK